MAMNPMEEMKRAQAMAHSFVVNYISKTPLGVPASIPEEQYTTIMDAITTAMAKSWADGYITAQKLYSKKGR